LLISVILPTRERPDSLRRAVASVLRQTYENWELLIVNDSAEPVGPITDDERIRIIDASGRGVAAARNLGLSQASGDVIAYLDDDNLMDPDWLKAIALTLEQAPETEIMIGAQLVTPEPGAGEHHTIRFPARFDWERLIEANYVDMGMLAHRGGNQTRFADELPAMVDWDFVVRLTKDRTPTMVPALSGLYLTGSRGRISYRDRQSVLREMRKRFAALGGPEATLANQALGNHDVEALRTMLRRLQSQLHRAVDVLVLDATPLARSVQEALLIPGVANVVGRAIGEQTIDLLVVESLPDPDALDLVSHEGFMVGLKAGSVEYPATGLAHGRRVGDHLWVGSRTRFDPEALFEGATLVKLGMSDET
jgi:hypothetical protein